MADKKSLVREMHQVQLAIELIELGARMQVLETETELSRGRLLRLYKEVRGMSPPKGMLPFSADWFVTWQPNIHSSLFHGFYQRLLEQGCDRMDAFVRGYKLYLEQMQLDGTEPVLDLTRAWTLVRFVESDILAPSRCGHCHGAFIQHAYEPGADFVCGICRPPSRAGKKAHRKPRRKVARREPAAAAIHTAPAPLEVPIPTEDLSQYLFFRPAAHSGFASLGMQ